MSDHIFTAGYEGLTLEAFIGRLRESGVKLVIDVRANPLSRKKGSSKNGFSAPLSEAGIAYNHLPTVGCPKPVRERYKQNGNWNEYTRGFLVYLKKQNASISLIADLAKVAKSCLVCFEADFNKCHRTFVARAVAATNGIKVIHLTNQKAIADDQTQSAA